MKIFKSGSVQRHIETNAIVTLFYHEKDPGSDMKSKQPRLSTTHLDLHLNNNPNLIHRLTVTNNSPSFGAARTMIAKIFVTLVTFTLAASSTPGSTVLR